MIHKVQIGRPGEASINVTFDSAQQRVTDGRGTVDSARALLDRGATVLSIDPMPLAGATLFTTSVSNSIRARAALNSEADALDGF